MEDDAGGGDRSCCPPPKDQTRRATSWACYWKAAITLPPENKDTEGGGFVGPTAANLSRDSPWGTTYTSRRRGCRNQRWSLPAAPLPMTPMPSITRGRGKEERCLPAGVHRCCCRYAPSLLLLLSMIRMGNIWHGKGSVNKTKFVAPFKGHCHCPCPRIVVINAGENIANERGVRTIRRVEIIGIFDIERDNGGLLLNDSTKTSVDGRFIRISGCMERICRWSCSYLWTLSGM
nr:hypothetical protein Iba_chr06cCG13780 [Ipomoea batatas]